MAESTRIVGPVEIEDRSAARVAFEFMKFIHKGTPAEQDGALELLARCSLALTHPDWGVEAIKKSARGR